MDLILDEILQLPLFNPQHEPQQNTGAGLSGRASVVDGEPCHAGDASGLGVHVEERGLPEPTVPGAPTGVGQSPVPATPTAEETFATLTAALYFVEYELLWIQSFQQWEQEAGRRYGSQAQEVAKTRLQRKKKLASRNIRRVVDFKESQLSEVFEQLWAQPQRYVGPARPSPDLPNVVRRRRWVVKVVDGVHLRALEQVDEPRLFPGEPASLYPGELDDLFWLPEHRYNFVPIEPATPAVDGDDLEALFWLPENRYTAATLSSLQAPVAALRAPGGMIGNTFPAIDWEEEVMLWSEDPSQVYDGNGLFADERPSRLTRARWRDRGLWWDTSLPNEQITFCPGDFLYSELGSVDPHRAGRFTNGAIDLRIVTSVTGGGYRHKLGDIRQLVESPGRIWIIREVLDGSRPIGEIPNIHFFTCFERQLSSYALKGLRQRLAFYLDGVTGSGRARIMNRWNLVIGFTPTPLVAMMRTLRDAAVKEEDSKACPLEARERLEIAYAALVAERPERLVTTSP